MNGTVPFRSWIGAWLGSGRASDGTALTVQATVDPTLFEVALRLQLHAVTVKGSTCCAIVAAIGPTKDDRLRGAAFGMPMGNIVLEQTPDDEGVLALAGQSPDVGRVSISLLREDEDLMQFTARWGEGEGFTAELRRLGPA
jgi:hypothetical protein